METKDKELLLKDLCARLPYCVYIGDEYANKWELVGIEIGENTVMFKQQSNENLSITPIEEIKPYLRPMSSMTKEEEKEYSKYAHFGNTLGDWTKSIDYLNAHYFDYRGLIEKGLAIEAPEGMYNF